MITIYALLAIGTLIGLYRKIFLIIPATILSLVMSVVIWSVNGELNLVKVLVCVGQIAALDAGYMAGSLAMYFASTMRRPHHGKDGGGRPYHVRAEHRRK